MARENSSVEAWENSSVEACGNVFVRLWSALKITASAHVVIVLHGHAGSVHGGRQLTAAPEPTTGAEYCELNGLDPTKVEYVIPNIDATILASIEANKAAGKRPANEQLAWPGLHQTNWCETTHCRAGYAICLAGKAGFELEKKFGSEIAGKMIYAVSRPDDRPLPDFHASDEAAMADIIASAEYGK